MKRFIVKYVTNRSTRLKEKRKDRGRTGKKRGLRKRERVRGLRKRERERIEKERARKKRKEK